MQQVSIDITSEQGLADLVTKLYKVQSQQHCIIHLRGELGAGKTTFARYWLRACGVQEPIRSPSYPVLYSYTTQNGQWHHFDCYRLSGIEQLYALGYAEIADSDGILLEWPENVSDDALKADIEVEIKLLQDDGCRKVIVSSDGFDPAVLLN